MGGNMERKLGFSTPDSPIFCTFGGEIIDNQPYPNAKNRCN